MAVLINKKSDMTAKSEAIVTAAQSNLIDSFDEAALPMRVATCVTPMTTVTLPFIVVKDNLAKNVYQSVITEHILMANVKALWNELDFHKTIMKNNSVSYAINKMSLGAFKEAYPDAPRKKVYTITKTKGTLDGMQLALVNDNKVFKFKVWFEHTTVEYSKEAQVTRELMPALVQAYLGEFEPNEEEVPYSQSGALLRAYVAFTYMLTSLQGKPKELVGDVEKIMENLANIKQKDVRLDLARGLYADYELSKQIGKETKTIKIEKVKSKMLLGKYNEEEFRDIVHTSLRNNRYERVTAFGENDPYLADAKVIIREEALSLKKQLEDAGAEVHPSVLLTLGDITYEELFNKGNTSNTTPVLGLQNNTNSVSLLSKMLATASPSGTNNPVNTMAALMNAQQPPESKHTITWE